MNLNAESLRVCAEIDTYLAGRRAIFTWLDSVQTCLQRDDGVLLESYVQEYTFVRDSQIDKLPDEAALKCYGGQTCYRTAYVERPEVPQSRVAMLSGVANLWLTIARLQDKIMTDKRIPEGQARNNCIVAYEGARINLQNWVRMARPHVLPALGALQRREERGRRVSGPGARMHTVHALLDELADLY